MSAGSRGRRALAATAAGAGAAGPARINYTEEIKKIQDRLETSAPGPPAAWKTVQLARHQERPQTLDYIAHGPARLPRTAWRPSSRRRQGHRGGFAHRGRTAVVLIGHQKGHTLKERQERSFGMARPEGYRKAMRLARLAEKFGLPVVTLVDTPGAYPGKDAEEGGQAGAIARSMEAFANLAVPTVAVVIGEGGSGGALALAVAGPGVHAGKLRVLCHLPGGMCGAAVAGCGGGPRGGRGPSAGLRANCSNWVSSTRSSPSPRAALTPITG